MSGRDTFLTGMQYEVVEDAAPWGLPLEEATLAERFKAAGYATHMVSSLLIRGTIVNRAKYC